MTDVCVPAMGDEGFVAWLDRVIDRHEKDLAEAIERTGRLTRALVKLRDARATLTAAAGPAKPAEPTTKEALFSCPHCPRMFASGASLGGHIGKAHPGAKAARQAAANAEAEALSKTTIDNADAARVIDAALARGWTASSTGPNGTTASPPISEAPLLVAPSHVIEAEQPADDPAPSPPPAVPAQPAQPGELVCALPSDRGGACWFAAGDAEQMDRHLRRRHSLYGGDDPDDVEYRAEAVRAAQAKAGLPAEWGL